jgi:hypothetical protein
VINNTAELICDVDGSSLFLASKSRNQFLMFRELFLFSLGFQIAVLSFHSNLLLKLAIFLLEWPPKKTANPQISNI